MKRGRGRPPKEPNDLITIADAVDAIRVHLTEKYGASVADRLSLKKGTLYNKTSRGDLTTWHKGRYAFVSLSEVLEMVSR